MQEIISVGNKIELEVLVDGQVVEDLEHKRVLTSRIMDLPQKNQIRIAMPFHEGRIVPLSVGEQYQVYILAEKTIYSSQFTVVERMRDGNLFMADMEMLTALTKIQRREFFRHSCHLSAGYRTIQGEEIRELTEDEVLALSWNPCVIQDISGGGVRMYSEQEEETGSLVQLRMLLVIDGKQQEFLLYGRMIASEPKKERPDIFEQRIEFEHIGERERELIIRYIFSEERKKISKEKGLD